MNNQRLHLLSQTAEHRGQMQRRGTARLFTDNFTRNELLETQGLLLRNGGEISVNVHNEQHVARQREINAPFCCGRVEPTRTSAHDEAFDAFFRGCGNLPGYFRLRQQQLSAGPGAHVTDVDTFVMDGGRTKVPNNLFQGRQTLRSRYRNFLCPRHDIYYKLDYYLFAPPEGSVNSVLAISETEQELKACFEQLDFLEHWTVQQNEIFPEIFEDHILEQEQLRDYIQKTVNNVQNATSNVMTNNEKTLAGLFDALDFLNNYRIRLAHIPNVVRHVQLRKESIIQAIEHTLNNQLERGPSGQIERGHGRFQRAGGSRMG